MAIIEITKGEDVTLNAEFNEVSDDSDIDISTATLKLYVFDNEKGGESVLEITGAIVSGPSGTATFEITSNQTDDLDPGRYYYQYRMVKDSNETPLTKIRTMFVNASLKFN